MKEGVKQSEIGFIPKEWKVQSIGETFKFSSGKSRPKNTSKEKTDVLNIPVYGGNGILGYTDEIFTKHRHLILGRVGEYCGCVHLTDSSSWISDNALYGKEKLTNDDLFFLKYCFEFMNLNQYSNKMGQPLITQGIINEIKFPVPPLPEQRKIAYVLNTVQKAIEQQDKLIRHTTELKKALMQKLFTEGTKGEKQKQTEIGLVPESWEVTTIGEMYDFTSKPKGLNVELPVPFIPMDIVPLNEIYIERYELRESLSSGTYVENGDLLLAKITPSFENGKQGIVSIDKPYSYATTEVIPIKDKAKISDKFYLFYYLLKDDVRKPLTDKMEGSTGRQRLSKTILEETLIPKPPIAEQKEIAKIFLSFNEKLSFLQKKKQTLSDLFKTLLYELMTGERRVHEIEFEALTKAYKIKEQPLSMAAEK